MSTGRITLGADHWIESSETQKSEISSKQAVERMHHWETEHLLYYNLSLLLHLSCSWHT